MKTSPGENRFSTLRFSSIFESSCFIAAFSLTLYLKRYKKRFWCDGTMERFMESTPNQPVAPSETSGIFYIRQLTIWVLLQVTCNQGYLGRARWGSRQARCSLLATRSGSGSAIFRFWLELGIRLGIGARDQARACVKPRLAQQCW